MITYAGRQVRIPVNLAARALNRGGGRWITPNAVTITGLIAHLPVAWFIANGNFLPAAVFLVFFGLFDTLDGELARLQKKSSLRGMLLDASTDRMKEVIVYAGVVFYFASSLRPGLAVWALVACGASLIVSYVKAKGEMALQDRHLSAQQKNRVFQDGVFRFEVRIAVLAAGLLFNLLGEAVILIALGAVYTAIQRLLKISRKL